MTAPDPKDGPTQTQSSANKKMKNATIERCAQKIKQFGQTSAVVYRGTEPIGIAESKSGEPVVRLICEYLEAAIRAMKEKL